MSLLINSCFSLTVKTTGTAQLHALFIMKCLCSLSIVLTLTVLRGRPKIDLITLNVKLTLRGRGVSHGFGINVIKMRKKTNEMVRKTTTDV